MRTAITNRLLVVFLLLIAAGARAESIWILRGATVVVGTSTLKGYLLVPRTLEVEPTTPLSLAMLKKFDRISLYERLSVTANGFRVITKAPLGIHTTAIQAVTPLDLPLNGKERGPCVPPVVTARQAQLLKKPPIGSCETGGITWFSYRPDGKETMSKLCEYGVDDMEHSAEIEKWTKKPDVFSVVLGCGS